MSDGRRDTLGQGKMTDEPLEDLTKANYEAWLRKEPRTCANPYADPNSPKSVAWREGKIPGLGRQSDTLDLRKECRDGGKGDKENIPDVAGH